MTEVSGGGTALPAKAPAALRTISEVSEQLGVPQHILRFWETRFPELRPMKRGGNRRYYRPEDVALCKALKRLLHEQGYTVKGVRKLIAEGGVKSLTKPGEGASDPSAVAGQPGTAPASPPATGLSERLRAVRGRLATALARAQAGHPAAS